jgi:hypothetical protein
MNSQYQNETKTLEEKPLTFQEIWDNAQKENSNISSEELEKWVKEIGDSAENKYTHIENKTIANIRTEIELSLSSLFYSTTEEYDTYVKYLDKLKGYRRVNGLDELHVGKHVRWINIFRNKTKDTPKLYTGGIVVQIDKKENDEKTTITCKNHNHFVKYKFESCHTFQKLSAEEYIVLLSNSSSSSSSSSA